jgi:hypothetical protein
MAPPDTVRILCASSFVLAYVGDSRADERPVTPR